MGLADREYMHSNYKKQRKSKSARTIEYWTRQVKRIVFLLIGGLGVVLLIYAIIWVLLRIFEMFGV